MPDVHEMYMDFEHEGTEKWLCPLCSCTILIEWSPLRVTVLDEGDENADHTGGK